MTVHVALLRGVNVGGRKTIAMEALRNMVAALGLETPETYLQSGNLIFRTDGPTGKRLEGFLEEETRRRLKLDTRFFVRTVREWRDVIDRNPFRREAERDPAHLVVMLCKRAPTAGQVKALQAAISGPEVIRAEGRQTYVVYPAGIGRSRLTLARIEKHLGTDATGRNWNTVLRLGRLAGV